jgi:hypothetical protein
MGSVRVGGGSKVWANQIEKSDLYLSNELPPAEPTNGLPFLIILEIRTSLTTSKEGLERINIFQETTRIKLL